MALTQVQGGMILASGQSIPKAALPTGSVLQVVSTIKTDTFSTTANTFTSITGLSASITPISASSLILVKYYVCFGQSDNNANRGSGFRVTRNGTAVGVSNQDGIRSRMGSFCIGSTTYEGCNVASQEFMDSPATTNALTYQVQLLFSSGGNHTGYVNRSGRYVDAAENSQGPWTSGITVMEITA
jgi:hypothetical protein